MQLASIPRRVFIYFMLLIFLLWLQSGIIPYFMEQFSASNIQLILILAMFLAFDFESLNDLWMAFIFGFFLDLLSGFVLGPWSAATISVYAFSALLSRRVYIDNVFVVIIVAFFSVCIGSSVNQLFLAHAPRMEEFQVALFLKKMFAEAFYTAILSPVFFFLFKKALRNSSSNLAVSTSTSSGKLFLKD